MTSRATPAFEVECGKPAEYLEIVRYHNEAAWDEINEGHPAPESGVSVHTLCAEHAAAYDAEALGMPGPVTSRSTAFPGGSRTCTTRIAA